jgi:hypothetical protein
MRLSTNTVCTPPFCHFCLTIATDFTEITDAGEAEAVLQGRNRFAPITVVEGSNRLVPASVVEGLQ